MTAQRWASDVVVDEGVLGDVLGVDGASGGDELAVEGRAVEHFHQVDEVLLGVERPDPLGVIWRTTQYTPHTHDTRHTTRTHTHTHNDTTRHDTQMSDQRTTRGRRREKATTLPIVALHVLGVEEEDGGGDEGDVKVLDILGDGVDVHKSDHRHLGQMSLRFGQLKMGFACC